MHVRLCVYAVSLAFHPLFATVAQLVERRFEEPGVRGSNPLGGTFSVAKEEAMFGNIFDWLYDHLYIPFYNAWVGLGNGESIFEVLSFDNNDEAIDEYNEGVAKHNELVETYNTWQEMGDKPL